MNAKTQPPSTEGEPSCQKQHTISTLLEDAAKSKALSSSGGEPEAWQRTIEKVVRSVVSVRFCHPCSFDTGIARASEASGFIVDAEKGYIMTNRHVVGIGPFWGYIVFYNQEEVDAFPVYRDPVHDFGILRFDPKAVKHMDTRPLSLRPDLAKVGVEIRVIGNDAGEKLSILSGFISRLDRNAPKYSGYQDFNTCYYQANAAATGGSSGSPVVNVDGYVIALQAGGRADRASTDYFLPLHGPLRALRHIQQGKPVTRGDIQCKFLLKPFDECRRLGLRANWEAAVREAFPKDDNMLVAETILPDGPSDQKIKEGDIVVKVNGALITQFLPLDDIFDSHIGKTVRILLQRGGEDVEVDIIVEDLSNITPDRFLTVAGASFHDLSYQMAQRYAIACKGVYVCEVGLLKLSKRNGWLIHTVDYHETPNLDTFTEVMRCIPDKARVIVSYKDLADLHTLRTSLVTINRHWPCKMKMVTRNDTTGLWDFKVLADALPPTTAARSKASFNGLNHIAHRAVANIVRSFVQIDCTAPFLLDGFASSSMSGMGLVVDADKGLVLTSRAVVPHRLCDVVITIADSVFVDARVILLHPSQNYALVQYDPALVDAPLHSPRLSPERVLQGASTLFVGHTDDKRMVYAPTTVTGAKAMSFLPDVVPCYRPMNADRISVDTRLGDTCGSGVLMTEDGTVHAVWLKHEDKAKSRFGLETASVLPVISQIQEGIAPRLRTLPVEFETIPLLQARVMGVSGEWIAKAEERSPHRQLFMVKRVFNDESGQLLEGDILLTLNGEIITRASELDVMYWNEALDAVIVRAGRQLTRELRTIAEDDMETDHVVQLCGAVLQRPHRAVRQQIKKLPSEVYVSSRFYGSPSFQYSLSATSFITHVDGISTPSLESVFSRVGSLPDNTYFRLKGVSYTSIPFVITMKKNKRFYPTVEWFRDPSEPWRWQRRTYENGQIIDGEGEYGLWS